MSCLDTIAAVSTPRGRGGIAVIRISGAEALTVSDRIFSRRLGEYGANRAVFGDILLPGTDGTVKKIDEGIAVYFAAPHSFTGEDTVELSCHGGVLITRTVLAAAFAAGARPAEAGEFTRRAFVNGKMGLDRAEALGNLINAENTAQMKLASAGMRGNLSEKTGQLYDRLMDIVSEMRADIDFPDEDVSEMTDAELDRGINEIYGEVVRLAGTYTTGRAVVTGIKTVICGRTNSGKSTLYNRITGKDAAIVTDIEGTTRDVLTCCCEFGGVTLLLSDTAGLRETDDPVEHIGVERAKKAADEAELVLYVADGSTGITEDDAKNAAELKRRGKKVIFVINKCDLPFPGKVKPVEEIAETVTVGAKNGEGMEKLASCVAAMCTDTDTDTENDAVVFSERQYGALTQTAGMIREASEALSDGIPYDLVCSTLERACASLAGIDGREVGQDTVDRIFSHFCVGK